MNRMFWSVFVVVLAVFYFYQTRMQGKDMELWSDSLSHEQPIDKKYTLYGENISPHLGWRNVPVGTKSLALIVEDPDAPTETPFIHAIVYNIDPKRSALKESKKGWKDVAFGLTDFKEMGYRGPKPPEGHGKHRYYFRLYALNSTLDPQMRDIQVLKEAIEKNSIAQAELMATYTAS